MKKQSFTFNVSTTLAVASLLGGCASSLPLPSAEQSQRDATVQTAAQWTNALPHGGSTARLMDWWTQAGDPALTQLMRAAQEHSVSLAAALSRMAQARAGVAQAEQATALNVSLGATASRATQQPAGQAASAASIGLQASWEADLWGGKQASQSAAQLRQRQAELGWHEARVAVAAETASLYLAYRHCERLADLQSRDAASRTETARLAQLTAQAGLSSPATAQLAQASRFDAANALATVQAQCDTLRQGLVALTGLSQEQARQALDQHSAASLLAAGQTSLFSIASAVPSLPAELLGQRPDIASAQLGVAAAAADIHTADAGRYPSLGLIGSISHTHQSQMGLSREGLTWSIGPLALTLPLTNRSLTRRQTEAALAAYEEAVLRLRASARQAVREVEESLTNLQAAHTRGEQSKAAAAGYSAYLSATQARHRAGLASLPELEEARRTELLAQHNTLAAERDRLAAWIALYRAAGGGGSPKDPAPPPPSAAKP